MNKTTNKFKRKYYLRRQRCTYRPKVVSAYVRSKYALIQNKYEMI